MAENNAPPVTVHLPFISKIACDVMYGPVRCVISLAHEAQTGSIKAIWRNEVGGAPVTPPRGAL